MVCICVFCQSLKWCISGLCHVNVSAVLGIYSKGNINSMQWKINWSLSSRTFIQAKMNDHMFNSNDLGNYGFFLAFWQICCVPKLIAIQRLAIFGINSENYTLIFCGILIWYNYTHQPLTNLFFGYYVFYFRHGSRVQHFN